MNASEARYLTDAFHKTFVEEDTWNAVMHTIRFRAKAGFRDVHFRLGDLPNGINYEGNTAKSQALVNRLREYGYDVRLYINESGNLAMEVRW